MVTMTHRKLAIALMLTLAVVSTLVSCGGAEKQDTGGFVIRYYRNLQPSQTPFDIEKGIHPITSRQARTINSYKFTWDSGGRLLTVDYVRNNFLINYSTMGFASRIVYEYHDGQQVKSYFNDKNEPMESTGVFKAVYTLDDKGIRTGVRFFGRYGEPVENRHKIHSYAWSILNDGMVRELRYDLTGKETVLNPFCPFYELRFAYNEQGYVIRMANYKADTLYNCTAENCGDVGVSYFLFEPDKNGDVLTFSVFNAMGQTSNLYWGWSKRVNTYDKNGYVTETAFFDQDNEYISGKRVPVIRYTYDRHGAVTEVRNLDKNRNLTNNPENRVSVTKYVYDDKGTRTETLRFDKDGAPVHVLYDLTNCCCF
jgi:hypothetical protein